MPMMTRSELARSWLAAVVLAVAVLLPLSAIAQTAGDVAGRTERTIAELRAQFEKLDGEINAPAVGKSQLADSRDDLDSLRNRALAAQSALQEPLANVAEQLAKLGDAPAEGASEPPPIAAERQRLTDLSTRLQTANKQLGLVALEAEQLATKVAERQRSDFLTRVFTRASSVIHPLLWFDGLATLPDFSSRLLTMLDGWRTQKQEADRPSGGFWFVLLSLAAAYSLIAALWTGWRRPSYNFDFEEDTLRRTWRAVRIPLISFVILLLSALSIGVMTDLQPRPERLTATLVRVSFFVIISIGVLRGVFRPGFAAIRLVDLKTSAAQNAFRLGVLAVVVVGAGRLAEEISNITFLPVEFTYLREATVTVLLVIIVSAFLINVRRPGSLADDGIEIGERTFYFGWTRYVFHVAWFAVFITLLALLTGHLALANYLMTRVVSTSALVATLVMLHHLVDAIVSSGLDRQSPVGRFLRETVSLGERSISALGLLLSSVADIGMVLLGIPLILAQWTLTWIDFNSLATTAFFGFKVGDITIEPSSILLGVLVLVIGLLIARLVTAWLDRRVLSRTQIDAGVKHSIRTGANYAGILMAAGIAVTSAGLDFSNLAIVFGALGVGIGFGLQSIVNNFVSGLILLAERPIKVGDWISVTGGEGIVKRINVRSTEIETFDRCSVIVPNSNLISEPVNNWYHNDVTGRVRIPVGVAYKSDPEQVEEILLNCAYGTERVVAFPEPYVVFLNFGANSLDFELRVYIDDVAWVTIVGSQLRFKIFKALKEAGIEIPFPQQDVYIKYVPEDAPVKTARTVRARTRKTS